MALLAVGLLSAPAMAQVQCYPVPVGGCPTDGGNEPLPPEVGPDEEPPAPPIDEEPPAPPIDEEPPAPPIDEGPPAEGGEPSPVPDGSGEPVEPTDGVEGDGDSRDEEVLSSDQVRQDGTAVERLVRTGADIPVLVGTAVVLLALGALLLRRRAHG